MNEILKKYQKKYWFFLEISIFIQFFILTFFVPYVSDLIGIDSLISKILLFISTSTGLYILIVKLPMYWFEKHGWKLSYPEYNFHGDWSYVITFYPPKNYKIYSKKGQEEISEILKNFEDNKGHVFINQTAFNINFQAGLGLLRKEENLYKTAWNGKFANLEENGKLTLNFSGKFGDIVCDGVDYYTVKVRHKNGMPIRMEGHFVVFPVNTNYTLRGELDYKRIGYSQND